MEGLHAFLVVLSAVISFSPNWACGSVLEVTAQPGQNITLYCDCTVSTGVFIVWYKNCTHKNQPPLVFTTKLDVRKNKADPRFHFVKNEASYSYDLLILNITESDEGFYYCGTEALKVEYTKCIEKKVIRNYGNITTRIIFSYGNVATRIKLYHNTSEEPVPVLWMMMFGPVITVLSTFISLVLVFYLWEKTESGGLKKRPRSKVRLSQNQDEDLCLTEVVFKPQDEETHQ